MASTPRLILNGLRITLVLVGSVIFLISGFEKIVSITPFADVVAQQGVISISRAVQVAWLVAICEIGVSVVALLWIAIGCRLAAAAAPLGLWCLVLACYATVMTVRPPPKKVGCGCGTLAGADVNWETRAVSLGGAAVLYGLVAVGVSTRPGTGKKREHMDV